MMKLSEAWPGIMVHQHPTIKNNSSSTLEDNVHIFVSLLKSHSGNSAGTKLYS